MTLEHLNESSAGKKERPKAGDDDKCVGVYASSHLKEEWEHDNDKAGSDKMSSDWDDSQC